MQDTLRQYDQILAHCRALFLAKHHDYGPAWRVLRMPALTDQIYIKAGRIRSIQETGKNQVGDSIEGEFVGIVNYCIIALMQLHLQKLTPAEAENILSQADVLAASYDHQASEARTTMIAKNHDYGEAWRQMRIRSMTDLILMKIFRLKQIENLRGEVRVSEGVEANYIDILNYAAFCLIRIGEGADSLD
ncbi:MAG: DUF1599 domain-containing protein [Bacteroidia bacterium]|jgi:hypothetical protein|nr:DUF1599 domain-containing protein [Bacteroidia bacterium]